MQDLIQKLEKATEGSTCIEWPRKRDKVGRGRIWHGGKLMLAHRWAWERVRGPIPKGMILCHHCDNPSCLNPTHLYVGTHADNMRDMKERRRYFAARQPERCREVGRASGLRNNWSGGERNPKAKLSAEQAAVIRASGQPTRELVSQFGVSPTTVQRIRRGAQWTL